VSAPSGESSVILPWNWFRAELLGAESVPGKDHGTFAARRAHARGRGRRRDATRGGADDALGARTLTRGRADRLGVLQGDGGASVL